MYYIVNYYEKSWGHVLRNTLGLSITVNDIWVHAKNESISPQILMHSLICLKIKIKTGLEILLSLTKTNDDGVHNRSCSIDWDENTLINASAITGALPIKAYQ